MNIARKTLFDIEFSAATQLQAVEAILNRVEGDVVKPMRVVTPNVHLTLLQRRSPDFRRVLNESDLCLVDGRPIFWASRLFKTGLPEVVTGSDLVPAVFAAHQARPGVSQLKVFLLGAGKGVAAAAARKIMSR